MGSFADWVGGALGAHPSVIRVHTSASAFPNAQDYYYDQEG